ncbi:hypothetical protein KIPB_013606, partial [Kipferlia bialata]|eukprot:g13606.t1
MAPGWANYSAEELRHYFVTLDDDGNGVLDYDEMRVLVDHISGGKASEYDYQVIKQLFDVDGDAEVDEDEFVSIMQEFQEGVREEEAENGDQDLTEQDYEETFDFLDDDNTGFISKEQLMELLIQL